jgi:hypothetical protein
MNARTSSRSRAASTPSNPSRPRAAVSILSARRSAAGAADTACRRGPLLDSYRRHRLPCDPTLPSAASWKHSTPCSSRPPVWRVAGCCSHPARRRRPPPPTKLRRVLAADFPRLARVSQPCCRPHRSWSPRRCVRSAACCASTSPAQPPSSRTTGCCQRCPASPRSSGSSVYLGPTRRPPRRSRGSSAKGCRRRQERPRGRRPGTCWTVTGRRAWPSV